MRITVSLTTETKDKAVAAVAAGRVRSLSDFAEKAARSLLYLPAPQPLWTPQKPLGRPLHSGAKRTLSQSMTLSEEVVDTGRYLARRGRVRSFSAFLNDAMRRYDAA